MRFKMTNQMKQKFTLRITQANKSQLVVILYEMTLQYFEEAEDAIQKENAEEFKEAIQRARACINELKASLHFEYEPAEQLLQLYIYVNNELYRAGATNKVKHLEIAKSIVMQLYDVYKLVSELDDSEPVMMNAQTVYAGLTYGKTDLNENLTGQGSERGFRV